MPIKLNYEKNTGHYSKKFMGREDGKPGRKYARLRHTPKEKRYLAQRGFISVNSSNVSAIAKDNNDLYVRFHGGSLYKYPNSAKLFENMLKSASKGAYVWKTLRKPRLKYQLVGSLPIPNEKVIEVNDIKEFNDDSEKITTQDILNDDITDSKLKGNIAIKKRTPRELNNYQNKPPNQKKELRKRVTKTQVNKYAVKKAKSKPKKKIKVKDLTTTISTINITNIDLGWVFKVQ